MNRMAFDHQHFAACIVGALNYRAMDYRSCASATGVKSSTLSRIIKHKKSPSVETLAALCAWMNTTPALFFRQARSIGVRKVLRSRESAVQKALANYVRAVNEGRP